MSCDEARGEGSDLMGVQLLIVADGVAMLLVGLYAVLSKQLRGLDRGEANDAPLSGGEFAHGGEEGRGKVVA